MISCTVHSQKPDCDSPSKFTFLSNQCLISNQAPLSCNALVITEDGEHRLMSAKIFLESIERRTRLEELDMKQVPLDISNLEITVGSALHNTLKKCVQVFWIATTYLQELIRNQDFFLMHFKSADIQRHAILATSPDSKMEQDKKDEATILIAEAYFHSKNDLQNQFGKQITRNIAKQLIDEEENALDDECSSGTTFMDLSPQGRDTHSPEDSLNIGLTDEDALFRALTNSMTENYSPSQSPLLIVA